MKKIFIILLLAVLFVGCDNNNDDGYTPNGKTIEHCNKNNYGFLVITNNSENPYYIYINSNLRTTISGKTVNTIEISSGKQYIYAEQKSGYLFFPATREKTINVVDCGNYEFTITPIL